MRYLSKVGAAEALQKLRLSFSLIVFRMDCTEVQHDECVRYRMICEIYRVG